MFGRANQDNKPLDQLTPAQAPAVSPAPPAPVPAISTVSESVIGEDLAIVGEKITVVSQSRVRVNGAVQGDINGREVVVGPKGHVTGTVTADQIQIEGAITGALRGTSVTLMPNARVDGDIYHQKLAISEGAQFDGRVRRPQDPNEVKPNLDVASLKGRTQG